MMSFEPSVFLVVPRFLGFGVQECFSLGFLNTKSKLLSFKAFFALKQSFLTFLSSQASGVDHFGFGPVGN